jgi:hypothetical protein
MWTTDIQRSQSVTVPSQEQLIQGLPESPSQGQNSSTEADDYDLVFAQSAQNEHPTKDHKKRHDSLS